MTERVKCRVEASKTAFAPGRRWTDAQVAKLRGRLDDAGVEVSVRNSGTIAAHAADVSGGSCPDGLRPLDLLRLIGMRGDDPVHVLRVNDDDDADRFARVAKLIIDIDPKVLHVAYVPREGIVVYVAGDRSFETRICEIIGVRGACRASSMTAADVVTKLAASGVLRRTATGRSCPQS